MSFSSLQEFTQYLEKIGQLKRIKTESEYLLDGKMYKGSQYYNPMVMMEQLGLMPS